MIDLVVKLVVNEEADKSKSFKESLISSLGKKQLAEFSNMIKDSSGNYIIS